MLWGEVIGGIQLIVSALLTTAIKTRKRILEESELSSVSIIGKDERNGRSP